MKDIMKDIIERHFTTNCGQFEVKLLICKIRKNTFFV